MSGNNGQQRQYLPKEEYYAKRSPVFKQLNNNERNAKNITIGASIVGGVCLIGAFYNATQISEERVPKNPAYHALIRESYVNDSIVKESEKVLEDLNTITGLSFQKDSLKVVISQAQRAHARAQGDMLEERVLYNRSNTVKALRREHYTNAVYLSAAVIASLGVMYIARRTAQRKNASIRANFENTYALQDERTRLLEQAETQIQQYNQAHSTNS